nr:thioredoxin domain-containing protein [Trueperaceae bacterium]
MAQHPNRLAGSASPYLRQHAGNPVDWYPWGEEAFAAARARDVPVLVSVGYSACHWCHVMAHESFEDPLIAAVMNEGFVNVKVDREERPDVDAVYMHAVQALTGAGGWPMTVVTTPEGEPWFGGTYFPPDDRFGRPGFRRVLEALVQTWRERRNEVERSAVEITAHVARLAEGLGDGDPPSAATALAALAALRAQEDRHHGGFGGAPKFPPHTALRWLLEDAPDDGAEPSADAMVLRALRAMVDGGIFDQLGGGFARYAVDATWTVPHFEKMLYDNALLLPVLARAAARHRDERLLEAARGTLDWLLRDLQQDGGAFASAYDADSEGEEGRFYTWTPAEIDTALPGGDDRALARALYGVQEVGQLEGRSVLVHRGFDHPAVRAALGDDAAEPERQEARVRRVREALRVARERRPWPALDDKIVTSWNALAVRGLVDAAAHLPEADATRAREAAVRAADVVWERAWDGERLRHLAPPGGDEGAVALLEDAATFGLAALTLHRATGDDRHLERALELAAVIERDFADPDGGFFTRRARDEQLVVRAKSVLDGPLPSEHGAASELLAWAAAWCDHAPWRALAEAGLEGAAALVGRHPTAGAAMLSAWARLEAPPREVVVAGQRDDPATHA